MHAEQSEYVRQVVAGADVSPVALVLDVGSLDINGSNRKFFPGRRYLGIDLAPGPGVDFVCPAHEYRSGPIFDVVISTECLEHDKHYPRTLQAMVDSLRVGGLLIVTCAAHPRAEHGTRRTSPKASPFTPDYYRNLTEHDFAGVMAQCSESSLTVDRRIGDLYFHGRKK